MTESTRLQSQSEVERFQRQLEEKDKECNKLKQSLDIQKSQMDMYLKTQQMMSMDSDAQDEIKELK